MNKEIKLEIEKCKTEKQVLKVLAKNDIRIMRDDSDEVGCFSIWIDKHTRIYKPLRSNMKVQIWRSVNMNYSGTPVFFG